MSYIVGEVPMVRLIRRDEYKEYKTEVKQVGTLYHVCTLNALVNYIIPENQLSASGKYKNALLNTYDAISFTRDSLFVVPTWTVDDADILFQFVVDGERLSEHYKVTPYQALDWTKNISTRSEKEEVVIGPIKNFKSYIKEVHFDIKSPSRTTLLKQKDSLEKVKEYLGSIKCTRTTLPYHVGNNKHSYKKTKNDFELYKIKTLDDLIQYIEDIKDAKGSDTLLDVIDSKELFDKYFGDLPNDQLITLLKKHPKWINIEFDEGTSVLSMAILYNNIELVKFIIEQGTDVNSKDRDGDGTPLYWACVQEDTEIIKLLLEHGADINGKIRDGETPLSRACYYNRTEVAKLLLDLGADPNIKDAEGKTPLYWAFKRNHTEIIKLLLEHGADANIKDKDGYSLLYHACRYSKNIELVKLLLEHGADKSINVKNKYGGTPLSHACDWNNIELVKLLLEHGAGEDLDINSLPNYITNNKHIEDLVLSYLNKNKGRNESIKIRRLYRL